MSLISEVVDTQLESSLLDFAKQISSKKLERLTNREYEILNLVAYGAPSKIIAYILGISIRTVEKHRMSITKKTGCHSQSSLAFLLMNGGRRCISHCSLIGECCCPCEDCLIAQKLLKC